MPPKVIITKKSLRDEGKDKLVTKAKRLKIYKNLPTGSKGEPLLKDLIDGIYDHYSSKKIKKGSEKKSKKESEKKTKGSEKKSKSSTKKKKLSKMSSKELEKLTFNKLSVYKKDELKEFITGKKKVDKDATKDHLAYAILEFLEESIEEDDSDEDKSSEKKKTKKSSEKSKVSDKFKLVLTEIESGKTAKIYASPSTFAKVKKQEYKNTIDDAEVIGDVRNYSITEYNQSIGNKTFAFMIDPKLPMRFFISTDYKNMEVTQKFPKDKVKKLLKDKVIFMLSDIDDVKYPDDLNYHSELLPKRLKPEDWGFDKPKK